MPTIRTLEINTGYTLLMHADLHLEIYRSLTDPDTYATTLALEALFDLEPEQLRTKFNQLHHRTINWNDPDSYLQSLKQLPNQLRTLAIFTPIQLLTTSDDLLDPSQLLAHPKTLFILGVTLQETITLAQATLNSSASKHLLTTLQPQTRTTH